MTLRSFYQISSVTLILMGLLLTVLLQGGGEAKDKLPEPPAAVQDGSEPGSAPPAAPEQSRPAPKPHPNFTQKRPVNKESSPIPESKFLTNYASEFRLCQSGEGQTRLSIRNMLFKNEQMLLVVDPQLLTTELVEAKNWTCENTTDDDQAETRFIQAMRAPSAPDGVRLSFPTYLRNDGLIHGKGNGSFLTGDLCPSHKPLDRAFFEKIGSLAQNVPIALSISGPWLQSHAEDFSWLQEKVRQGMITITWVNHSFHHPYFPSRPLDHNFLLVPGVSIDAEIFDMERLLIEQGEVPSVFFRFPGLISSTALQSAIAKYHLLTLGADGWLALGAKPRDGSVILVHPNGNEPLGLAIFSKIADKNELPMPFRALDEAP